MYLNKDKIRQILKERFANDKVVSLSSLYPPSAFENIIQAAEFVKDAVTVGKKIAIVGDYDVDGVTSAAILSTFLNSLGTSPTVVIPNRFKDGYGLNPQIAANVDCDLLITVDNGITALEAANICKQRNIELIIIDHHALANEMPYARYVIHPLFSTLEQKNICAAVVTWYFVAALKQVTKTNFDMKSLIDLAAIAAIADITPLTDINRVIVKAGLEVFKTSAKPYAVALRELIGDNITSGDVAFKIAPRLNSSGRIEDATLSYEFLTTKTLDDAREKLRKINELNEIRKAVEKTMFEHADSLVCKGDSAIVVWSEQWSEGVVGIVAARLAKHYERPAFVISINKDDAKGSARAPKGYDLYALMSACQDILTKFGGHKLAGGFSLKASDLEKFKTVVCSACIKPNISETIALGELSCQDIDMALLELLDEFEPFGEGNARPIFTASDARIIDVKQVGKTQKYTKLTIAGKNADMDILHKEDIVSFKEGQTLAIAYSVSKSIFRGKTSILLNAEKLI